MVTGRGRLVEIFTLTEQGQLVSWKDDKFDGELDEHASVKYLWVGHLKIFRILNL